MSEQTDQVSDKQSGKKIEIMCEGKILLGILSLILYCKYRIRRLSTSFTAELRYDTRRRFARNCPHAENPEKVES